ncbi:hypothetical protein L6452_14079 [Arctium lappa]|uniref:Uncharacterized protein n=1 Tax=Arctium lappa TaxID=4217 RepID=A0ACB9CKE6_ARCLA|nr:hypothetical protein L6452_14079 [Arctium lappa]
MKALRRFTKPILTLDSSNRNLSSIAVALPVEEHGSIWTPEKTPLWVRTYPTRLSSVHQILQKCAREKFPMEGMACHGCIIQYGLWADTLTSNMLINMYSKCGFIEYARKVFDQMPERSLVSWNTMMGSYTQNGQEREALDLFVRMQREGTEFSEFTLSGVLCACAAEFAVFECRQLHAFALKASMLTNMFVGTALLDVYAKCVTSDGIVYEIIGVKLAIQRGLWFQESHMKVHTGLDDR